MRFFTVFTLVCWVFLATLYLPIASADDDDGAAAAAADPSNVAAAAQAMQAGAAAIEGNIAPVSVPMHSLVAQAASPGELTFFFTTLTPSPPSLPYFLASIHSSSYPIPPLFP